MKRTLHITAILLAIAYLTASALPTRWLFFDPGQPVFSDAPQGTAPSLSYVRTVHRSTLIRYSSVTRDVKDNKVWCRGDNGAGIEYRPVSGPLVGLDLVRWSGNDRDCARLPPGRYWNSTTWTIVAPARSLLPKLLQDTFLAYILPPRNLTEDSPVFAIYEAADP